MRRPTIKSFGLIATLLLGTAVFACGPGVAEAHRPWGDSGQMVAPPWGQEVSLSIESGYGGTLPTYQHRGSMFVAGQMGERYNIRVRNNSGERVEAVVTVDGRDVVSGQLGNYKTQRGYVLEPYGSVLIEGFRQSLDHVAAFRFTDVGNSYSGRWGTPQHVGVIGVAVFKEHQPRRPRTPPAPIATRPYYEPFYGDYDTSSRAGAAEVRPAPAPADAPAAKRAASAPPSGGYAQEQALDDGRSARLGTQYGETTHSSVREVTFERRAKRRPDVMMTVYYDSAENLRARGVIVDPYVSPPPPHDPRPFPASSERHNQYAPPPPARRY
ncbi:hypothetical protein [Nannocystis bainbridge]|uniref:Outer membrane lipoprotein n=1 Tax=Nannocystis bainbridge TaxID=2995303 RepID=A0ABT5DUA5_9BACT|nr:hypothetical protein [Nannocystis bainbridge]MDC0717206.1 hypothetical protein [Nannocystis bainbridge]